ncbi:hypothetical protein BDR07DRAFT_1376642 [Suillus spraguei]|nr:hypothetical protein BDR07DRAFT_1376642 [Suillus spraguei]
MEEWVVEACGWSNKEQMRSAQNMNEKKKHGAGETPCGVGCGVLGMGAEGAGDAGDADQRSRSDVDPQDLWLCEEDEEPIRVLGGDVGKLLERLSLSSKLWAGVDSEHGRIWSEFKVRRQIIDGAERGFQIWGGAGVLAVEQCHIRQASGNCPGLQITT